MNGSTISARDLLSKSWVSLMNNKGVIVNGVLLLYASNMILMQLFKLLGFAVVPNMKPAPMVLSSFSFSSAHDIIEKAHTYFVTSFEWKSFSVKFCFFLLFGIVILHYTRILLLVAKNKISQMSFIDSFMYVINSFIATIRDTLYASASSCIAGLSVFLGMVLASFPYFMLLQYVEQVMGDQGKTIALLLILLYFGILCFFLFRLSFFVLCMLDNNGKGPWESLRCSWAITQNKVLTLVRVMFTLMILMILFSLLSTVIGIFSFFFLPGVVSMFIGILLFAVLVMMSVLSSLFMTHLYLAMSGSK